MSKIINFLFSTFIVKNFSKYSIYINSMRFGLIFFFLFILKLLILFILINNALDFNNFFFKNDSNVINNFYTNINIPLNNKNYIAFSINENTSWFTKLIEKITELNDKVAYKLISLFFYILIILNVDIEIIIIFFFEIFMNSVEIFINFVELIINLIKNSIIFFVYLAERIFFPVKLIFVKDYSFDDLFKQILNSIFEEQEKNSFLIEFSIDSYKRISMIKLKYISIFIFFCAILHYIYAIFSIMKDYFIVKIEKNINKLSIIFFIFLIFFISFF